MFQNSEQVRRPRGRPQVRSDADTRQLLIVTAAREFQANGYAGTSIGAVALAAGISTKTLYRLVPTKADLFSLVVNDRITQFMMAFDASAHDSLDLAVALERILAAYGTLTLGRETIAITRLVLGECDRFPEIAAAFYENATVRTNMALAAWLARQCERGRIRLADPQLAAGMLRGMMIMEVQRATMLGQRAAPDATEIAARAKACTELFLGGCRL